MTRSLTKQNFSGGTYRVLSRSLLLASVFLWVATVSAETRRDAGGTENRVAGMVQQLREERDGLKAENEQLKQQITELQSKVDKAKESQKASKERMGDVAQAITKLRESNSALRERIESDRDKTQSLLDKFRATIVTLKEIEADRNAVKAQLTQANNSIEDCSRKNVMLYDANIELIDKYRGKGMMDVILQHEPVTQLKQAEIDNIGEEFRAKSQRAQFASDGPQN